MLLHPTMAFDHRDAVIGELVARARFEGGAWAVALVGVLLPGLRRAVWPLVQMCPGKAADIEAEALAALLVAVAGCEPGRPRLASRLCWLARNAANRLLSAELAERARPANDPVSAAPPPTVGASRSRARQGGACRGGWCGGRRAHRRHPPRGRGPGRCRPRPRDRLRGVSPTAPSGRVGARRVAAL